MNPDAPDTIYTKTAKGLLEISNKTVRLSRELGLVFLSVDGKANVGDLLPRSGMSAAQLHQALNTLVRDGYIQVAPQSGQPTPGAASDFASPEVMATAADERSQAETAALADEVPQPEIDTAERVRQLNVRVQASRGSRGAAERQSRDALAVDSKGNPAEPNPNESAPALQWGDITPGARAPHEQMPSIAIPVDTDSVPAKSAPPSDDTARDELPVVDLSRADRDREPQIPPTSEHLPSALERVMAQMAARTQLRTENAPAAAAAQAHRAADEPPEAQAQAGPAEKLVLEIADDEPLHERLNIDRAAHDIIAESAAAHRKAEAAQFNRDAINARRQRAEDDARRAALAQRRRRRKHALWIAGAAVVVVPAAAIAWLQYTTLDGYIPEAQRVLSQRLNQPVTIAKLRYVLLPTPRLVLEGVTVGDGPGVRAERVEAHVLPLAALATPRHVATVDVHRATVDAAMLGPIAAWTGGRTPGALHVDRLRLTEARLVMPGRDLGTFDGDVAFASNGIVKEAVFTSPNANLELTPRAAGVRFTLDLRDSRIPFGPPVEFSHMAINGLIDRGRIAVADFSGNVAGGSVEGSLTARWAGPISVQGEFKLQDARVQDLIGQLAPNFAAKGSLRATGRFGMQGAEWTALHANPQVEARFSVARGELTNVDLIRALQAPSMGAIRGGRTPFDELSGVVQIAGGRYQYRQLRLVSGAMHANGTIDVGPNGQLDGRLYAELSSRSGVVARSTLDISGTMQDPQLKR